MKQEIFDFIKKEIGKGSSKQEIREALLAAGHSTEVIEAHFKQLLKKLKKLDKSIKQEAKIETAIAKDIKKGAKEERLIKAEEKIEADIGNLRDKRDNLIQDVQAEKTELEKAKSVLEKDIDLAVIEYIRKQKSEGFSEEQIRAELESKGHEKDSIEKHLNHFEEYWKNRGLIQKAAGRVHEWLLELNDVCWHAVYWTGDHFWRVAFPMVVLACLIAFTHYVLVPNYQFYDTMREGKELFFKGQYGAAMTAFQEADSLGHNKDTIYWVARTNYRQQNYGTALELYRELERLGQKDFKIYQAMGWSYLYLGNYSQSVAAFDKALELKPEGVEWSIYQGLGRAWNSLNDTTQAEKFFLQSLHYNKTASILRDISRLYVSQKEFSKAEGYLLDNLDINPKNTEANCLLSQVYLNLHNATKAIPYLKECRDKNPADLTWQLRLANAYYYARQYKEAIPEFVKYFNSTQDRSSADYNTSVMMLGEAYYNVKDYENATKWLEKALAMEQNLSVKQQTHYIIANAEYYLGNYSAAIKYFNQSGEYKYFGVGRVYIKLKQYRTALDYFKQEIALRPNNAQAHAAAGKMLYEIGSYNESSQELNTALELGYSDFVVYKGLALVSYAVGDTESSVRYFKLGEEKPHSYDEQFEELGKKLTRLGFI